MVLQGQARSGVPRPRCTVQTAGGQDGRPGYSEKETRIVGQQAARVGVIGCGNISGIYLQNGQRFGVLDMAACADIDIERARERAAEYGVPAVLTVEQLLADPQI